MDSAGSPARIDRAAFVFIRLEVWFVKTKSYAMPTSPGAVKLVGRLVVKAVSDTENMELPESMMLKRLPVVVP